MCRISNNFIETCGYNYQSTQFYYYCICYPTPLWLIGRAPTTNKKKYIETLCEIGDTNGEPYLNAYHGVVKIRELHPILNQFSTNLTEAFVRLVPNNIAV